MPPVPSLRGSNAIAVATMDCIRCGTGTQFPAETDQQRFKTFGGNDADIKLLWTQQLIPFRTITFGAVPTPTDASAGFADNASRLASDLTVWDGKDATDDGSNLTIPTWGNDYQWNPGFYAPFGIPGFNPNLISVGVGAPFGVPTFNLYLWSYWMWWAIPGNADVQAPFHPIKLSTIGKVGFITQVLCPNAFKAQKYELWTVTIRNFSLVPSNDAGEPGLIPSPFAWSLSGDFSKASSGVLNPGQQFIMPVPVSLNPQQPPAPPSFADPTPYGMWEEWGVAQFIVFTGSA